MSSIGLIKVRVQNWSTKHGSIKHGSTCFLSLESALTRCKKLYPLLKSWFLSVHKKVNEWFDRLFGKFSNLVTEFYMYFYRFLLQHFIWFNLYLQWEDSLTSKLHAQIHCFLEDIACKFVKIRNVKKCRNISYWKHKDAPRLKESKNYVIFQYDFKWKFDNFYKYSTQSKSKTILQKYCNNVLHNIWL